MFRTSALFSSIVAATLVMGASAPALAQSPAYRAVPATQVATAGNVIVGDSLWACSTAGCTTAKATARPAIVCEQAAKRLGKFTSFTVGDQAFDEAALAKCNAKARS